MFASPSPSSISSPSSLSSSLSSLYLHVPFQKFMMIKTISKILLLIGACTAAIPPLPSDLKVPSVITLRAGIMDAAPFAFTEVVNDNKNITGGESETNNEDKVVSFSGFQPDLIERIQRFAAGDNITLNVDMELAEPQNYFVALDLIANDCNTTANPHPAQHCHQYDILIGDYWGAPDRMMRVDLTPAFLRTAFTTVKYLDKVGEDFTTITQASVSNKSVCVLNDLFLINVLLSEFPNAKYMTCESQADCIAQLKAEECVLFMDEELQLRYASVQDLSLEVTIERFNTQYILWPMDYKLDPTIRLLMKRWIFAAVKNKTLDELYHNYFEKHACPIGWSGLECDAPCNPNHGIDVRGVCVCESTRWTGSDCNVEVLEDVHLIPTSLALIGDVMFGINVAAVGICAAWLFVHRTTPQVRISQPSFLGLVLLGCLISSSTIVPLGEEDSGHGPVHACMAIPWLYSVGFSITFGTLFAKIRRVYLIFKSAVDFRKKEVSIQETFSIIGSVLCVDVIILIAWTITDPLHWERSVLTRDKFGHPLESEGHCTSDHWQIFASIIAALHFFVMGVACYLCYVSRDIPTDFSEGKYVAIAMISNLQIFVVGIPVLVILGADAETSFFVRSVIIWMNDLVVLGLIFGNLVYNVHFVHRDTKDMKTAIGSAIKKYSVAVSQKGTCGDRMYGTSGVSDYYGNSSFGNYSRQSFNSRQELEPLDEDDSLSFKGSSSHQRNNASFAKNNNSSLQLSNPRLELSSWANGFSSQENTSTYEFSGGAPQSNSPKKINDDDNNKNNNNNKNRRIFNNNYRSSSRRSLLDSTADLEGSMMDEDSIRMYETSHDTSGERPQDETTSSQGKNVEDNNNDVVRQQRQHSGGSSSSSSSSSSSPSSSSFCCEYDEERIPTTTTTTTTTKATSLDAAAAASSSMEKEHHPAVVDVGPSVVPERKTSQSTSMTGPTVTTVEDEDDIKLIPSLPKSSSFSSPRPPMEIHIKFDEDNYFV